MSSQYVPFSGQPYRRVLAPGDVANWPRISRTIEPNGAQHDASYLTDSLPRGFPAYRSRYIGNTEYFRPYTTTSSIAPINGTIGHPALRPLQTLSSETPTYTRVETRPVETTTLPPGVSQQKQIDSANERELIEMFPRLDPMLVTYIWRETPEGAGRIEKCIETLMGMQEKEDRKARKAASKVSKLTSKIPLAKKLPKNLPLIAGGAVGALILLWILSSFLFGGSKAAAGEILCSKTTSASECDALGCIYNRQQTKCYLPEPDDLLNSQSFAFPYKMMVIGEDDVGKTTLLNGIAKAYGSKESLSTKEGRRAEKFQRIILGQLELFDTPGLELRHDSQDTAFTLRRFVSGIQMGDNLDKDWTRWSVDRNNAINRVVIVLDVREGMKFGFLWNTLDTGMLEQWRKFIERFSALGTAPPVIIVNTFGKKPAAVKPLIDELAKFIPQRHIFQMNAKKVQPLDLSRFLYGVLRDAKMLPMRQVPGFTGYLGAGRQGYGYGGYGGYAGSAGYGGYGDV